MKRQRTAEEWEALRHHCFVRRWRAHNRAWKDGRRDHREEKREKNYDELEKIATAGSVIERRRERRMTTNTNEGDAS